MASFFPKVQCWASAVLRTDLVREKTYPQKPKARLKAGKLLNATPLSVAPKSPIIA
jgi:hypothetical protein